MLTGRGATMETRISGHRCGQSVRGFCLSIMSSHLSKLSPCPGSRTVSPAGKPACRLRSPARTGLPGGSRQREQADEGPEYPTSGRAGGAEGHRGERPRPLLCPRACGFHAHLPPWALETPDPGPEATPPAEGPAVVTSPGSRPSFSSSLAPEVSWVTPYTHGGHCTPQLCISTLTSSSPPLPPLPAPQPWSPRLQPDLS